MNVSTSDRDWAGVYTDPKPLPRVIRAGEQRFPRVRAAEKSYLEHVEDDLERATARIGYLSEQVAELKRLLQAATEATGRTESANRELRLALARGSSGEIGLTRAQMGNLGLQESRRRAKLARREQSTVELIPGVSFDEDSWRLVTGATTVRLSPNEAAFFRQLLQERGRTQDHELLAMAIWRGEDKWDSRHILHVMATRLRGKLRLAGIAHLLTTVSPIGYRLELP